MMKNLIPLFIAVTLLAAGLNTSPSLAQSSATYEDVAKILAERCVTCHQGDYAPLGLKLDNLKAIQKGSQNGAVIKPGDPDGSELIRRIRGTSLPRMPMTGPPYLSAQEINLFEAWVRAGQQNIPETKTSAIEPAPSAKEQTAAVPESPSTELQSTSTRVADPPRYPDVARIFLPRCAKCHAENGMMGAPPEGFIMTSYRQIMAAGERARVIPGVPGASELIRRIRGDSRPQMPFDGPPWLTSEEIQLVIDWVAAGAQDAQGVKAPIPAGARVRFEGILSGEWEVDGFPLLVDSSTRIKKHPGLGQRVEVRGIVLSDGSIQATRIRRR